MSQMSAAAAFLALCVVYGVKRKLGEQAARLPSGDTAPKGSRRR